jgi:peroxiredoxin (alkyl hydroperoxide reductase subunit C)
MAMMGTDQSASYRPPGPVSLGMLAPDFEAKTTHGKVKLSDYKGKWVILFSHPGDFTPVCTTEFIAFAKKHDEFVKRNVQLLGLTVDSLPSHIAWVRSIEEHMGVHIPFPTIADLDTRISRMYGMIHPDMSDEAPIRSLFIIDPNRIVRMIFFYPAGVGRSSDEILRIMDALQLTTREKVATPADWKPGDPVLVSSPHTQQDAEAREKSHEGLECKEWYLCTKKL